MKKNNLFKKDYIDTCISFANIIKSWPITQLEIHLKLYKTIYKNTLKDLSSSNEEEKKWMAKKNKKLKELIELELENRQIKVYKN